MNDESETKKVDGSTMFAANVCGESLQEVPPAGNAGNERQRPGTAGDVIADL